MRLIILMGLFISQTLFAEVSYNSNNCMKEETGELKVKMNDLGWKQPFTDMAKKFDLIYNSGKRLEWRAYKEGDKFFLPVKDGESVALSDTFINSVKSHIETALSRKYADFVFFSDMGHAHLFVDNALYEEKVKGLDPRNWKDRYEIMLNASSTKFLYHTAEQLLMVGEDKLPIKDKHTQWRFYTRNLVGDNHHSHSLELLYNPDSSHNTSRELDYDTEGKYKYWGSGYDISASKDGCFEYKKGDKTYYFDISLYALSYDNVGTGVDDEFSIYMNQKKGK